MSAHSLREYDLGQMSGIFAQAGVTFYAKAQAGLSAWAKLVERSAKAKFGDYQPSVGSFQAWAPLADSTKEERVRLGFTPDDPLFRSGGLKMSIGHEVWGLEAAVGSTSEIMVYQELGTATIPARPVLGPAAFESQRMAQMILGNVVRAGVLNTDLGRLDGTELTQPGYSDT